MRIQQLHSCVAIFAFSTPQNQHVRPAHLHGQREIPGFLHFSNDLYVRLIRNNAVYDLSQDGRHACEQKSDRLHFIALLRGPWSGEGMAGRFGEKNRKIYRRV